MHNPGLPKRLKAVAAMEQNAIHDSLKSEKAWMEQLEKMRSKYDLESDDVYDILIYLGVINAPT